MKTAPVVPAHGRLFQARAAAEYLGITEHKVRALIGRGDLIALRTKAGRFLGVYEDDCDAWRTAHRRTPPPPKVSAYDRIKDLLPTDRRFA